MKFIAEKGSVIFVAATMDEDGEVKQPLAKGAAHTSHLYPASN